MEITEKNLFFSKIKNNQYKIFATIENYDEDSFEVAIWTDTIHFENDEIEYTIFENITKARKYILKKLSEF